MPGLYKKIRIRYEGVKRLLSDNFQLEAIQKSEAEINKTPLRSDIINYLLASLGKKETNYLEIGVRNPANNFDKIISSTKYSVDPGVEFKENPVDFKLTSDEFFEQLGKGQILSKELRFDVIFVDGLHTADQTDKDIENALAFTTENGFVVLHDCNPPTESHARETYEYWASPAMDYWSGTTWKAFFKYRKSPVVHSCCIDTDWGVGIISKKIKLGSPSTIHNPFFEYSLLEKNRKESLNLIRFDELKTLITAAASS
ncbi:MAG TPA: class I SAM-dependent methyltransferase [Chitinophagaceae bacterium]